MWRFTDCKQYRENSGGHPVGDYRFVNPPRVRHGLKGHVRTCAVLLFWLGCRDAGAQGVGAQIIAALEHYRVAVAQMDYDDEVAAFAEEAELSQGDEPPLRGRAQIRAQLNAQAGFKVVGYELQVAITRVQGPTAIQNGFYSQRVISPQHESIVSQGVFEIEWSRQADGTWLISRLHTDPRGVR